MGLTVRFSVALSVGGALAIVGTAPLTPPTQYGNTVGWVTLAVIALLWVGSGIRRSQAIDPTYREMFITFVGGTLTLLVVGMLSGPETASSHLVVGVVAFSGIVLPLRFALIPMLIGTAALGLPLVHDPSNEAIATVLGRLGLMLGLGVFATLWTANMLRLRHSLAEQRAQADHLARIDVLTGLGNRRALNEAIDAEQAMSARTGQPLCALVLDLNGFKQINDTAGHHEGDRLLTEVASALRTELRLPDVCFRWGGDEFVVILRETDLPSAHAAALRVVAAVRRSCTQPDGRPLGVAVGCAQLLAGERADDLIVRADAALLDAKRSPQSVALALPQAAATG